MDNTNWNQKTVQELEEILQGKIVKEGTEAYEAVRQSWMNSPNRPALFCLCESTEDVQAAVIYAAKKGLPLSVRSGGHDWEGSSVVDKGLVIDLQKMDHISIDAEGQEASIGGGTTTNKLVLAADQYDLVPVVGTCGTVSVAGFTLGGGYGLNSPKFGLGVDNLLSAEVVLADGRAVVASKTENPDLFWAIRGGGGNFGVLVKLRVRLHPVKEIMAGMIIFPFSEAKTVLEGYNKIVAAQPHDLYLLGALSTTPDGHPIVIMMPVWSGEHKAGEEAFSEIRKLGTPVMDQLGKMRLKDLIASLEERIFKGRNGYGKSVALRELTPEITEIIMEANTKKTSPFSVATLFPVYAAPTQVAVTDTAFGTREKHLVLVVLAEWENGDGIDAAEHRKWADDTFAQLKQHAIPGGYINMLHNDDQEQIIASFGRNLDRIKAVKQIYDPGKVFTGKGVIR